MSLERVEYEVDSDTGALRVREVLPAEGIGDRMVVFVHGLTFPAGVDFDLPVPGYSLAGHLAGQGIGCLLFDLRGYGQSYKPGYGSPIGIDERAVDLAAICDHLRGRYPNVELCLVGLSSGCNVIARFVKNRSEAPSSVVLIAPCYLFNPAIRAARRRARVFRFLRTLLGRRRSVYVSMGKGMLRDRLYRGEEHLIDANVFERFVDDAIRAQSPGSRRLRAPVLSFPELDSARRLWEPLFDAGAIRCPVLILRGEGDLFCCARTVERLLADIGSSRAQARSFAERKHDLHLYRRHDDFFAAISDFVAGRPVCSS